MTESVTQSDFDKAKLLLPWYAKNKLSPENWSWVTEQLEDSSLLRKELSLIKKQISKTENYVDQLDTSAYENNPERLSKLISTINQNTEAKGKSKNNNELKLKRNKGFWNKLISSLPFSQSGWPTAGALALGIMLLQGIVISQLIQNKPESEYTTLSEENTDASNTIENKPSFLTRFHLNATVYELDELLTKYQLSIKNGPDTAGIYKLIYQGDQLSEDAIEKMITELEAIDGVIRFIAREN